MSARRDIEDKLSRAIATARAKQVADKEHTMKTGVQTSEFWLALATTIAATVLLGIGKITPEMWAAVAVGSTGVYSSVRGLVKSNTKAGGDTNGI